MVPPIKTLHPLDAGLLQIGAPVSGLAFPPPGWKLYKEWGLGYVLLHRNGLRAIIDCEQKEDDRWWVHISVSRQRSTPTHEDMARTKWDFLGNRYAYAVFPPTDLYVNIHTRCLHLWALIDDQQGKVLPEFSDELPGIGLSI